MSITASSKEKPFDNYLSLLIDSYKDDPMKSIAVLFTDIVGSTKYFKIYGDIDGREMLRQHQNMATPIIHEYKGNLIKVLGDSVMAYFSGPSEAILAAIKMQHTFRDYNAMAPSEHQIRIRIGVHYGKVIIEEKDIYGDVVNVAAKLTNLAHGDEIYISEEVYGHVRGLAGVPFEVVDYWNMKEVPSGLKIYKALWENAVLSGPSVKTFLHVRPVSPADDRGNQDGWETLTRDALFLETLIKGQEEYLIAPDKSLVAVFNDPLPAVEGADQLLKNLRPSIAVKAAIYKSQHIKGMTITPDTLTGEWDSITPGEVYVSPEVHLDIKETDWVAAEPVQGEGSARGFHKIRKKGSADDVTENRKEKTYAMPDERIGAHKPHSACFYCGSGTHYPADCPSKDLTWRTTAFHQLGYLSISKIHDLVATYLKNSGAPFLVDSEDGRMDMAETVFLAFYELKRVFQLPFFRIIWNNPGTRWEKVKSGTSQNEGGIAWLAQDSIRVSDHARAESLLVNVLEKFPDDYKGYCLMGYLNIEKNNLYEAKKDFEKAFTRAKTNPQKIFILFQLARICTLHGDIQGAQDKINSILFIDPGCPEAVYMDIQWKLQQNKEKTAMQYLVNLIRDNKDYYVAALIDPDMEPYKAVVEHHLGIILKNTRESALSRFRDAEDIFMRTRDLLSEKRLTDGESMRVRIKELMQSDSYFGYLDVLRYSDFIIKICESALKEQKQDISEVVDQLMQRIRRFSEFIKHYRYRQLIDSYYKRIMLLMVRADGLKGIDRFSSPWQFDSCNNLCREVNAELDFMEPRLKRLELVQQMLYIFLNFLKYCSAMLSIVFFIGIFVFPLFSDPLNAVLTRLDVASISNAWSFQKTFLIMGGIAGFIVSFFLSIKKLFKDNGEIPSL